MGFSDEVLDADHADYANTCCIDIRAGNRRGGKLARQWNVYIMAQAKARHPDWKNAFQWLHRDPDGKVCSTTRFHGAAAGRALGVAA